jgi:hypothetical protein
LDLGVALGAGVRALGVAHGPAEKGGRVKYLGWLILGVVVGVALMWIYDHWGLVQNREKISGASDVISGFNKLFGGA